MKRACNYATHPEAKHDHDESACTGADWWVGLWPFAIAFAVALIIGQDPAALTFDQGAARKHLQLCLQRKQLEPFPTTKKLKFKKNRVTGREVDSIYCLGRGIWVIGQYDRCQCSTCSQWYKTPRDV